MIEVPAVIKTMLHNHTCPKNIRIHFPNGERTDICNDLIVKNSVQFTESLCSQNTLKFGLCESPIFECEVVGVGNVKGATIEVSCEIYCDASVTGAEWRVDIQKYVYAIPYGTFVVDECKRQADLQHRKIKAYNVLAVNLNRVDPIIDGKAWISYATPTPYEFNVFATALTNCGVRARLANATYTEISSYSEYGKIAFGEWECVFDLPDDYSVRLRQVFKASTDIYADGLFYVEKPSPLKSDEEALDKALQDLIEYDDEQGLHYITDEIAQEMKEFFIDGLHKRGCNLTNIITLEPSLTTSGSRDARYVYVKGASGRIAVFCGIGLWYERNGAAFEGFKDYYLDPTDIKIYEVDYSSYPQITYSVPRNIIVRENGAIRYVFDGSAVKYYDLTKGLMELSGLFWYTSRDGGVKLLNIRQQFGLTPRTDLYPGSSLKPQGVTGGKLVPKDYQSCWYDDAYMLPFGAITCDFKTVETIEGESKIIDASYTMYLNGFDESSDTNAYQVYELKGNAILSAKIAIIDAETGEIKIIDRTWTPEQISAFCTTIAANLDGVTYMPVDFVGRGLPYVEAGDTFEILTRSNDSITTIVLNRTLKGEQTLTDSYKSV